MNRYKFLYFVWLLPLYLGGLLIQQINVYYGIEDTFENGNSYTAEVVDFDFRQIAAQTNGYIVVNFEDDGGNEIERKLSLPIEMAGKLQETRIIPVRYQPGASQEIVLVPAFDIQKGLVLTNMGMAFVGFLLTFFLALYAHRYAGRKLREGETEYIIERIDQDVEL